MTVNNFKQMSVDDEYINDEYIDNTIIKINDVHVRDNNLDEISNKIGLLRYSIKYLTGYDMSSPELTFTGQIMNYSTCICSCVKCRNIFIIECNNGIKIGVGSSCIKKFNNQKLNSDVYYSLKANKCDECNQTLVFKETKYRTVNCSRNDSVCFDCITAFGRIYLNVPYKNKDYAKSKAAKWDVEKKKWYIYRDNKNYHDLISKYQ